MKNRKSLVLAFTLAVGLLSPGGANAQTAAMAPSPDAITQQQAADTVRLNQADIDNFAYNIGVQTAYPLAGRGFTMATTAEGQRLGFEFTLNGGNATVVGTYNLDDVRSADRFQQQVNNAYSTEQLREAQRSTYGIYDAAVAPATWPEAYIIGVPNVAVTGYGLGIDGWYPGYVPFWTPWVGFSYMGGYGYHGGYGHDVRGHVVNDHTWRTGEGSRFIRTQRPPQMQQRRFLNERAPAVHGMGGGRGRVGGGHGHR